MKTNCIRLLVLSFAFATFGVMSMSPTKVIGADLHESTNAGATYTDGYNDGNPVGYAHGAAGNSCAAPAGDNTEYARGYVDGWVAGCDSGVAQNPPTDEDDECMGCGGEEE